jgi:hypothetical protein
MMMMMMMITGATQDVVLIQYFDIPRYFTSLTKSIAHLLSPFVHHTTKQKA